jgi:quercetin dioxygenase-like cupin family protein
MTLTMQNRWTFLGIAAASLLPAGIDAQSAGPRPPAELARHALTGPLEGFEAVLVELNIQPGARSSGPGHRHPGPVLGYVVEGQMRFAINHEPEQVLPAGGTFFEPSGAVHTTTGSRGLTGPRVRWSSCWYPRAARSRRRPDRSRYGVTRADPVDAVQ